MLLIRILVTYLSLPLLFACGLLSSRHAEPDHANPKADVLLEVESHHWNDIVVYLMNGNQSQRLGTVAGVSSNRFVFPYRQLASGGKVRLRAYPVGGQGSYTSEDVVIQPGQSIKWTLEGDLSRSSMSVY